MAQVLHRPPWIKLITAGSSDLSLQPVCALHSEIGLIQGKPGLAPLYAGLFLIPLASSLGLSEAILDAITSVYARRRKQGHVNVTTHVQRLFGEYGSICADTSPSCFCLSRHCSADLELFKQDFFNQPGTLDCSQSVCMLLRVQPPYRRAWLQGHGAQGTN